MTSDLRALLAAIVADPSDDVARLVYADCLEEHGNAARAQFIRLQIEAERHHPHSNTRAALEAQSRTLFEQHWVEWWDEVCAAVKIKSVTADRYRLAQSGTTVAEVPANTPEDDFDAFAVSFQRGFPEAVAFSPFTESQKRFHSCLEQWSQISPLHEVIARGWSLGQPNLWPHGSHFKTVRNLTVKYHDPDALKQAIQSPHFANVERLTLLPGYEGSSKYVNILLAAPCVSRLKHLTIPVVNRRNAETIASSDTLAQLESLDITHDPIDEPGAIIAALAGGSTLAGLRQLRTPASSSLAGMDTLCRDPIWSHLQSLHLSFWLREASLHTLATHEVFPELEECFITGLFFTPKTVHELVRAPVLKRVRHFALLSGAYHDGRVFFPLVDAVDPARIETFAIGIQYFPERAANALRAKFGERVRFLPT